MNTEDWLHVYPAGSWHDSVTIVGTCHALRLLAETLLEAANRGVALGTGTVNDGEGYWIEVLRVDDLQKRQDIPVHYVDDIARAEQDLPRDLSRRLITEHRKRQGR